MFVYDFKFDDLSKIVYNTWLKYKSNILLSQSFVSSILMTLLAAIAVIRLTMKL